MDGSSDRPARGRAQWTLVGVIAALAVGAAAYRLLKWQRLDETAALFVGLPAVLAIALALTPRATSATGMILKGMTIALLLSGPLLGEGFICILFASPLFYGIGALVGAGVDAHRRSRRDGQQSLNALLIVPLLVMSVEGVRPMLTLPHELAVTTVKRVAAPPAAVEAKLAATPRFADRLPNFLAIGFPRPASAEGAGLAVGDIRTMTYGRGDVRKQLVFEVAERRPGYARFRATRDESKIGTWLTWHDAEVRWIERPDGATDVEWTLHFSRRLSPGWYFGPLESYGAAAAADYLIDSLATP
jgi:hypothetical protein